jgi:hypothetical protein
MLGYGKLGDLHFSIFFTFLLLWLEKKQSRLWRQEDKGLEGHEGNFLA